MYRTLTYTIVTNTSAMISEPIQKPPLLEPDALSRTSPLKLYGKESKIRSLEPECRHIGFHSMFKGRG